MADDTEYKVHFGKVARTLVYEDGRGTLCFTFDVIPAGQPGQWKIEFDPLVQEGEWSALALERAKAYVVSRGYVIDGPKS